MPEVLLGKLRDQHLEDLSGSVALIHQRFEQLKQQSEQKKASDLEKPKAFILCGEQITDLLFREIVLLWFFTKEACLSVLPFRLQ